MGAPSEQTAVTAGRPSVVDPFANDYELRVAQRMDFETISRISTVLSLLVVLATLTQR